MLKFQISILKNKNVLFQKKICSMLVKKGKFSGFLNSNTCFCSRLYGNYSYPTSKPTTIRKSYYHFGRILETAIGMIGNFVPAYYLENILDSIKMWLFLTLRADLLHIIRSFKKIIDISWKSSRLFNEHGGQDLEKRKRQRWKEKET